MTKRNLKTRVYSIFLAGLLVMGSFQIASPMKVHAGTEEEVLTAARSFDSEYDTQNAYSGNDLGCTYTPEQTTFKVWSPLAEKVVLCRYESGNGGSIIEETDMAKGDKGIWSITIQGDIVNTYYTYKVTVGDKTSEAVDIYAKAVGVNGDRAMVVDLDGTDPEDWDRNYQREETRISDIIVWEVHIRDFSIDVSSGVSPENRGKYKAFTEDTTINGEGQVASCVNYLMQLGVTHVQILPMFDYAAVDETDVSTSLSDNYSWGYDPENYNVPEGSYASDPYDGNVRIRETKEMIQALHDAGIKVVMDVAYNYTNDAADSNFNKIMPDYYYKLNGDLTYRDQSGYGNATRSESAMYRKFMIDSICYWAEEYNVDGFRFDQMGIYDYVTMNQIRETLDSRFGKNTIVMYGEGWTARDYDSNSAHKANESKLNEGIGYFNDQIRDAVQGTRKFDSTIGLVQTNYTQGDYLEPGEKWPNNVFGGIMGSVGYTSGNFGMWRPFWSKSSNCTVSYASSHNDLALWDKLTEKFGKNYSSQDEKMLRMNKMAGSVVLVSKGGVFMQAGEEFARTKNGDNNSYASPDSVNMLDWSRVSTYSSVRNYYEGMIQIRKAFSGFRSVLTRSGDNYNPTNNNMQWISKDVNGMTGFYETNNVPGEWNRIAVLINNRISDTTAELTGSDKWVIIADGTNAGLNKLWESGSSVTVPGKSVLVAVPKDTFEGCSIKENRPPVIEADAVSYSAVEGKSLSFTVDVSDPDGDDVVLTASDVPEGAAFNGTTGTFEWTNTKAGTYVLKLTASSGKYRIKKNIKITIVEKLKKLQTLVEEIEAQNYEKENFTEEVWTPFDNALTTARQRILDGETDDTKIAGALTELENAYEEVKTEASARETLSNALVQAEERVVTAKNAAAHYDAAAITDLEAVNAEIAEFLTVVHSAKDYEAAREDVEDAMKACVSLVANPVIRVKADEWSSPSVYVWKGSEHLAGDWPGTLLTTTDAEGWYVFELPEGTTGYSVVVNNNHSGTAAQTADIENINESADITVSSFEGKGCTYTMEEYEAGIRKIPVDKARLSAMITSAEQVISTNPNHVQMHELKRLCDAAKTILAKEDATQVEVNQSVRELRNAIREKEDLGCSHEDTSKHKIENRAEATCNKEGYTGDTYCTNCGALVAPGEKISVTEHTWDAGTITKQATAAEDGEKTYICTVCAATRAEAVKAAGQRPQKLDLKPLVPLIFQIPKAGTRLTDRSSGAVYVVTKAALTDGEVSYVKPTNAKRSNITILDKVTIGGITYKVTAISGKAFRNNKKLKKITIGRNLIRIGKKTFFGCKNLKKITIKTKKLTRKNVGSNSFKGIHSKAIIKVPKSKLSAYRRIFKARGIGKKVKVKK